MRRRERERRRLPRSRIFWKLKLWGDNRGKKREILDVYLGADSSGNWSSEETTEVKRRETGDVYLGADSSGNWSSEETTEVKEGITRHNSSRVQQQKRAESDWMTADWEGGGEGRGALEEISRGPHGRPKPISKVGMNEESSKDEKKSWKKDKVYQYSLSWPRNACTISSR